MNCKFCKGPILKERIDNCRSKNVIYCSQRCGHNYWNKYHRKARIPRPTKNCLNCGESTNKVKDYCGMRCYHQYQRTIDTTKISTADYEVLNKSFVGMDDICVVM
jgi:hypothetical protein